MFQDYREKLQSDENWIAAEKRKNVPTVINDKYDLLKEIILSGNAYHAILCVKDLFETIMKVPAVMGLVLVNKYIEEDNEFLSQGEAESKELNYVSLKQILDRMLSNPLSMGGWHELIQKLVKSKDYFELDIKVVNILMRTDQAINHEISKGKSGKYNNVVNWRNEVIGHGVISANDDIYWKELYGLLSIINDYYGINDHSHTLNDLYENVRFEEKEGIPQLVVENKVYDASHFVRLLDAEMFYFDAYYSNKHLLKMSDFIDRTESYKNNSYFEDLVKRLKIMSESFDRNSRRSKVISTGKGKYQLACLKEVLNYQRPAFIIDKLNDVMDKLECGMIMLQMERGTGKTTLVHQLDGRYINKVLQEDLKAIVRVYHIGDMNFLSSGKNSNPSNDFYKSVPSLFEMHPVEDNISDYDEQEIETHYHPKSIVQLKYALQENETTQSSLVELLSLYRDIYSHIDDNEECEEYRLVLIIDGIDEINKDTMDILRRLPSQEEFKKNANAKNIFIVLTSRKESENNISDISREAIGIAKSKIDDASALISIESHDENYYSLLEKYVYSMNPCLEKEVVSNIIERAQNKFLYIRPFMTFGDVIYAGDNYEARNVAHNYITSLMKMYFGISQNNLYIIMSAIALLDEVSLHEIGHLILGDGISYDIIGCINDLSPLLTTVRRDGTTKYKYANSEYTNYILETFSESVKSVIDLLDISIDAIDSEIELNSIEYLMGIVSQKAEWFERINDGSCFTEEEEKGYQDLAYKLMFIVLKYLDKMLSKNIAILNAKPFIDLFNYISAYGRANKEIKEKSEEVRTLLVEYCANSKNVNGWFEQIFISGDVYGNKRKRVVTCFGVNRQLVDYICSLSDDKMYQGWYIHLHIENLRILFEYCLDPNLKEDIVIKLKELFNREFTCPAYYKETYESLKKLIDLRS